MSRVADSSQLASADRLSLLKFPSDYRTILNHFDLDPRLRFFVCCPSCCTLYEDVDFPDTCTFREFPSSSPCSVRLKWERMICGKPMIRPVRKFAYQELKGWLGRILSYPEIESALEAPLSNISVSHSGNEPFHDIFDASFARHLNGYDGKPFLRKDNKLWLLFSLAADGFNPFGMKVAKGTSSVTGIYMACLNLPADIRYNTENMYLCGVIPGPKKPSLEQINNFIRPLVNELLEFWNPGVFFSRTAHHRHGRAVVLALIPLVCDVLGARQVGGFLSHAATLFCSFCYLPADMIESLDMGSWPMRTAEEHRAHAEEWLSATTGEEREQIAKMYGVRHSELLRLPYWDPIWFTVLDSMHAFFLHSIPQHIRYIWGLNPKAPAGDGTNSPTAKPPPRPPAKELLKGLEAILRNPTRDIESLSRKCSKSVLWYLCLEFDLRRAGTSVMLVRALVDWVSRIPLHLRN